jgi:spermidine synthase
MLAGSPAAAGNRHNPAVRTDMARPGERLSRLLHIAFLISGAAALIYEVLWMRRFTVLLGATAPATAATLSAVFLGLAIGSVSLGAAAARVRRPLRLFGILEAGIAVAALAVEPLLAPAKALAADSSILLAARMALAMAAILPAAILMGGSLPVLARALDAGSRGLGVLGGGLYALNTLGAAAGAMAVPALLLPWVGATGSLWIAAMTSLLVGALAIALDRAVPPVGFSEAALPERESPPRGAPARASMGILTAAFVSGAVTLALEVLFTRALALVHENSLYSFATVLAVFLCGLAAGAGLARFLLARGTPPSRVAGAGWIAAGIFVMTVPALFHALTSGLRYAGGSAGLLAHEIHLAGLALATMLPVTLCAGAVLPALMQQAGSLTSRAGAAARAGSTESLGVLLGANTMGALAGPWIALFVTGPALGLWWSLAACGVVMLVAGEVALRGVAGAGARASIGRCLLWFAAGAVLIALWRPGDLPAVRLEPGDRLVDTADGPFGTVAVVDRDGNRRLMLNNFYVLGGTASLGEERLQAHLPLLLHPSPKRVALLGLGTGITAGAVLFHPVEHVIAMELVKDVVVAAGRHFTQANLGVLGDARVQVEVEDARTGLRRRPSRFDVIVGDLVVPWRRGEASLYTRESFDSAKRALAPGGIFCQWVPLFQLSRPEFDTVAATFLDVFPRALLWRGDFRAGEPAVALVGLTDGAPLDPAAIEARWRAYALHPDPANPYLIDAAGLWAYLVGPLAGDPAQGAAPRSTDDHPVLELRSAAAQFGEVDPLFRGEPLRRYLDQVMARPLAGTPLERLGEGPLRWREAGMLIWSASLLELQGQREAADALGLRGMAILPEPIQRAVLGSPAPPR